MPLASLNGTAWIDVTTFADGGIVRLIPGGYSVGPFTTTSSTTVQLAYETIPITSWTYGDRVWRDVLVNGGGAAARGAPPAPVDVAAERERLAVRERARDRATETLLGLLNESERAEFERDGHIVVHGSAGGRYRIDRGYQQNVYELDPRGRTRVGGRLCAHPVMDTGHGRLPVEDAMIAQVLMLRYDEPGFLAIANRS